MDFQDSTYDQFYGKCRIILAYAFKGITEGFTIYAENIAILSTNDW